MKEIRTADEFIVNNFECASFRFTPKVVSSEYLVRHSTITKSTEQEKNKSKNNAL